MKKLLLIFYILFCFSATAQWYDCIDETRVQPLYQCNQEFFDPVCGCDGMTYRNQCQAYNNYGVSHWVGGVCNGFFLDFYPNPIDNMNPMNLNIQFQDLTSSSLNIRIIDYFGHLAYQALYNNVNKVQLQLELRELKIGVYLIIVESGEGQMWFERFIKI